MKNVKKTSKNNNDTSKLVYQGNKLKNKLNIRLRDDYTDKQKELFEILTNKNTKIVFLIGPAGTAKTYTSILSSLQLMNDKKISDILYVRAAVESSDSKLGFLPGELDQKLTPYIEPLLDKLKEILPAGDIQALQKEERIDGVPINYLRGLNWNSKCIIADEAQNMTIKELITLITRIGEFSRIFICADPDQSDIKVKSGITQLLKLFDDEECRKNGIYISYFDDNDIVRSGICKFLLKKLRELSKL